MTLPRLVLFLSAGIFVGFGIAFTAFPGEMVSIVGIRVRNPTARADIRATYGGFQVGVGAFLFVCQARKEWIPLGLLASTFALAGFAIGRSGSALADGPVSDLDRVRHNNTGSRCLSIGVTAFWR